MTTNQIVGCALLVAGISDDVMLSLLRGRMPPGKSRVVTVALVASAAGLVGFGLTLLLRG